MKKLILLLVLLTTASYGADYHSPYDPGAARKSDLGTISTKAATDYVATSALALRLDTTNASISNNLDVAGNVGAATVNGVAPLTAAEKTQALVGSGTADFMAQALLYNVVASGTLSTTDIATITIALPQSAKGGLWFVIVHVSGNNVFSFRTAMSAWIGNPYISAGIQSMLGFDYTGGTAVTLIRVKNNREFGQYVSSGDANLLEVVIDASTIATTCSYEIRLSPRF